MTYALIGAAIAFVARRLYESYKSSGASKSSEGKSSCSRGCGCGDTGKHD
jgi:hypothetical protein